MVLLLLLRVLREVRHASRAGPPASKLLLVAGRRCDGVDHDRAGMDARRVGRLHIDMVPHPELTLRRGRSAVGQAPGPRTCPDVN